MLFNGERRIKDDRTFNVLGTVDELSSFTGLAREHCANSPQLAGLAAELEVVQCRLQELGSHVATPRVDLDTAKDPRAEGARMARTQFAERYTEALEQQIDTMDESLPPLTSFILPSGGLAAASLHCCRSVCRRAERELVPLLREGQVEVQAYTYLNRLSDYFFAAARFAASETGAKETVWEPGKF